MRFATIIALGLTSVVLGAVAPRDAQAQSADDLEAAKKAYAKGKAFFEKGQFDKAVEQFKESYRLSKNPLLLYNIALTFEKLGTNDMALFYYKKFLSDAPEDAAQRADAEKSIAALEKAASTTQPDKEKEPEKVPDKEPEVEIVPDKEPEVVKKKPKRDTCLVEDFQHEVVDEAPPGTPLDLSAFVNEEATCNVVLFYRGSGQADFTTSEMKPRYNELVARIPADRMGGNAVQYYIEVKTSKGELVTRVGKATSPNVVFIDEAAKARYYPDLDDGDGTDAGTDTISSEEDDNPLNKGKKKRVADEEDPTRRIETGGGGRGGGGPGGGFFDVGSSKFGYAKWGATGLGAGGLALSITFSLMASSWASSLEAEAQTSNNEDCAGGPPCRSFDDYRKGLQATGQRYETMSKVFFGVGLIGIGVAGYFWYEELMGKKKGERKRSAAFTPVVGDDFVGGSAAMRF